MRDIILIMIIRIHHSSIILSFFIVIIAFPLATDTSTATRAFVMSCQSITSRELPATLITYMWSFSRM